MAAIDYVDHRSEDAVLHPTMHALASDMSVPLPSVAVTLLLCYHTYPQTAGLFVACLMSATLCSTRPGYLATNSGAVCCRPHVRRAVAADPGSALSLSLL